MDDIGSWGQLFRPCSVVLESTPLSREEVIANQADKRAGRRWWKGAKKLGMGGGEGKETLFLVRLRKR